MKFAAAFAGALLVSASATLALVSGCASDSTPSAADPGLVGDVDGGTPPPSGNDAGTTPPKDSAPASTCAPSCNTDQDCQSTCSAVNNGVNCCDSTHVCFQWSGTACPAQAQDSGSGNPPY